ncbi:MAG: hypothetical protein WA966_16975, partial [Ornithinimicrobium sp.]
MTSAAPLPHQTTDLSTFFDRPLTQVKADPQARLRIQQALDALESGTIRAAERDEGGVWTAYPWVKHVILA